MANNEGTPLHGDRSAWNTTDHADEHARDINDSAYKHHVPAAASDGNFAVDDGTKWVLESGATARTSLGLVAGGAGDIWVEKAGDTMTGALVLAAGTASANTAPVKFTAGTALGTPEAGAVEFHNSRLYITNVAHQRAVDRTSNVAVETVTVENTTTETTLWTGAMAADSLVAGNLFKFHADGVVENGGPTAADQITINIKVGGVTKVTLTPVTKTLPAGTMWHINANATQRTIGASGSRAMHVHLVIGDPLSTGDEVWTIGVAAIDTTANMDVTVTAQWASADAANIISLYQAFMEYKN